MQPQSAVCTSNFVGLEPEQYWNDATEDLERYPAIDLMNLASLFDARHADLHV